MDERIFERVVMEQKDPVFGFASMMLRNPAEAQDVVQEALVRLWQNRDRVEVAGAHLWLRRTVQNLCVDRLRRARVRQETHDERPDARRDHGPGPERLAESSEIALGIERGLAEMTDTDRAVLLMREVDGLTYEEIAQVLEVPLGTLKARLHRARHGLRARLVQSGVAP